MYSGVHPSPTGDPRGAWLTKPIAEPLLATLFWTASSAKGCLSTWDTNKYFWTVYDKTGKKKNSNNVRNVDMDRVL
eukprot:SAG25_NODE_13288_length_269_cov_0.605882_1_plen_75_part_10